MKKEIRKISESEVLKTFPIKGRLDGWYFRAQETSNGIWEIEGCDLWSRNVYCQGAEDPDNLPETLLNKAINKAKEITGEVNAL